MSRSSRSSTDPTPNPGPGPGPGPGPKRSSNRTGVLSGLGAYLIWGAMPVYFLALAPAGPWEILVNRILWSLVLCLGLLLAGRRLSATLAYLRVPRQLVAVTAAGLLIATNWTVYLIAVTSGRVAEAALGYFLNPLFSVALGLVLLGERLRPLQWVAVSIGAFGAGYLSVVAGSPSWIALALAMSFGLYGLMKKRVGADLPEVSSLAAETLVLAPLALTGLGILARQGELTYPSSGLGHALLLTSTGLVTTVPLLLFAAAARRVPLVTVGLLQFVAPVLQFLFALALGETMSIQRWTGFSIVWLALTVLIVDIVRLRMRPDGPHPSTIRPDPSSAASPGTGVGSAGSRNPHPEYRPDHTSIPR